MFWPRLTSLIIALKSLIQYAGNIQQEDLYKPILFSSNSFSGVCNRDLYYCQNAETKLTKTPMRTIPHPRHTLTYVHRLNKDSMANKRTNKYINKVSK